MTRGTVPLFAWSISTITTRIMHVDLLWTSWKHDFDILRGFLNYKLPSAKQSLSLLDHSHIFHVRPAMEELPQDCWTGKTCIAWHFTTNADCKSKGKAAKPEASTVKIQWIYMWGDNYWTFLQSFFQSCCLYMLSVWLSLAKGFPKDSALSASSSLFRNGMGSKCIIWWHPPPSLILWLFISQKTIERIIPRKVSVAHSCILQPHHEQPMNRQQQQWASRYCQFFRESEDFPNTYQGLDSFAQMILWPFAWLPFAPCTVPTYQAWSSKVAIGAPKIAVQRRENFKNLWGTSLAQMNSNHGKGFLTVAITHHYTAKTGAINVLRCGWMLGIPLILPVQ